MAWAALFSHAQKDIGVEKGTGAVQIGANTLAGLHTITAAGTTGNQTINKVFGRVNVAAGNGSVTVTNSLVTADSHVIPFLLTNDATAKSWSALPMSGSFTINHNAAATGEVAIGFVVFHGF
jgi:hypothetical protein